MFRMGSSLVVPSRKEVRKGFDASVSQYCSLTLSQIEATFQLWRDSKDYSKELTFGLKSFEEIFGGLFDDCEVHYSVLKLPYDTAVKVKVAFIILGLLATYDKPQSRIDFIWKVFLLDLNEAEGEPLLLNSRDADDMNQSLVVNTKQIQGIINFVLESMKILYAVQIPTSYKIDFFVTDHIVNFKVRQNASTRESLGEEENRNDIIAQQSSSVDLTRDEFWWWCQDSMDVMKFLAFPDKFREEIQAETSVFKKKLFLPVHKIDFLQRNESPLWKFRVVDMVDDTFYEHMPSLDLSEDIFTALEHSILSTSHSGARSNVLPMLRGLDEDEEEWIRELVGLQKPTGSDNAKSGVITATQLATSASRAGLSSTGSKGNSTAVGAQALKTNSSLAMLGASASRSGLASKGDKLGGGALGSNMLASASRSGLAVSASRSGLVKSLGVSGSKSVLGVSASKSILNSSSSKSIIGGPKMLSASSSKSIIGKVMATSSSKSVVNRNMLSVSSSRSVIGRQNTSSVTGLMRGSSSFIGIKPDNSSGSMRRNGSKGMGSTASLSSGGKGEINEFCGLFDITHVVAWLATCCPANMISEKMKTPKPLPLLDADGNPLDGEEEEKEEREPEDDTVRDSAYYKKLGQTGQVNLEDLVSVMKHVHAFKNHAKQKVMELWTDLGMHFASTDLAGALFDEEEPIFDHRPAMLPMQFLTLENTIYNVLEILAAGHKGVPLCTDPERSDRVTHVMDMVCVGNFLYHHDVEFFGSQLFLPVMEAEYVRQASRVPNTWNLATTITALKDLDTESALITDDTGKVCGLFSAESAIALWRAWWAHCNSDLEGDLTMDEMRELYSKGIFSHFDGYARGFSVFSALANQLDRCNIAGVHVDPFEEYVEEEVGRMLAKESKLTADDRKRELIHSYLRYHSSASSSESGSFDESMDEDDDDSADSAEKEDTLHKMHKPAHARAAHHGHPPAHRRKSVAGGRRKSIASHAPPSHTKPSGRAPRGGSKAAHTASAMLVTRAQQEAEEEKQREDEREKERVRQANEKKELELLKKECRDKAVQKWLSANHAVAHNSNLQHVLLRMHECKISKVYIINTDTAVPLGSVHITDLCRKLLRDEAAQKINGFGAFRRTRHKDVVVQNVDI